MTVQEWLGKDNQLGIDIWTKKYQQNNETFDEWLDRVSGGNNVIRDLIVKKKFLFGGRILSNRGLEKQGRKITLSNCYVITPPEDNIESIFECATKLARTYSYGGGCGVDLSKLSPRGAKINNSAKQTTGAVSFMDLYNLTTDLIGQNGRRGAMMISLSCDHPDLEEFIGIKSDLNRINKANISIRITDEFMRAVTSKSKYTLSFTREETGEVIEKEVDAYEIFKKICEMNWDYAEPGVLFWDRIKNWNLLSEDKEFEYAGTNPCITGDTLISTINGEIAIADLVGTHPYVYCMDENGEIAIRQASRVWGTRRHAKIVLVKTHRGSIRCTPDHLIHTRNRGWVPAIELRHGDKITGLNRCMKDEKHVAVSLSGSKYIPEHRLVASAFYNIEGKDVHHIDGNTLNNTIDNLEVLDHYEHSKISNTGHHIDVIRDDYGRYVSKPTKCKRESFNLGNEVGTNWFVDEVYELAVKEDVYDMTVPGVHNFVANRMVVHNCAEEPLPAGGSCLLGSINLAEFVDEKGEFKYLDFILTVDAAIKALNDVLGEGLCLHPLKEQQDSVYNWRQIGLGIFGLADMLIKMHIPYGSKESLELCDRIASGMINQAITTSAIYADQWMETYPKYKPESVKKSAFYLENANTQSKNYVDAYGLFNSQLLTIAPTGTLSTMLGVSGGIEPIFANYYERKTESLHGHNEYYKVYTPIVKKYMEENGISDDSDLPNFFVTAQNLNYKDRIAMQSVWQKHIDASISSTVNVPNDFTVEDVMDLYITAWREGLKGVTIFRDGCKRTGILSTSEHKEKEKEKDICNSSELGRGEIIKASDKCIGKKRTLRTGCGTLHCEAFFDPDTRELREVYLSKGSTGGCNNFMIGLSRMISLSARGGVDIYAIVDQLTSSGTCPSYAVRNATKKDTSPGSSCPVAVGKALIEMYKEMQSGYKDEKKEAVRGSEELREAKNEGNPKCPECGHELTFEGGCNTCKNCGYSKCD